MTRDYEANTNLRAFRPSGAAALTMQPDTGLAGPAFHTFRHGRFEVNIISDGHLVLPTTLLAPEAPPAERLAIMQAGRSTAAEYKPPANIALLKDGDDLILFDTGGVGFQPEAGMLAKNLALAQIDPEHITKVVFTHGHPDHIWGTVMADGALRFPNAVYYSGATEWDFWNGPNIWAQLPSEQHSFAVGAQRQYAAVRDRVTMLRPGDDIVSGIRAIATPGHTPGHLSFDVDGDDGFVIVGDAVTAPCVYFPHPEWTFGFDADHEQASTSRKRLLDRAAGEHTKLLGYHWPYPGVGHAERNGSGYRYVASS